MSMTRGRTLGVGGVAAVVILICICVLADAYARPVADMLVICDVFTPGDEISVWVTAVNPTHEFEIDVYLSGVTNDSTLYLSPSGWGTEEVPFIAGYMMPQFAEPLTLKLASVTAGQPPSQPGQRCTLRLWLTPSNVPEMVYSEDEAAFSTAPDGFVAIPSGRFMMGTGNKSQWAEAEVPHRVCIHSFFIAKTETTYRDFVQFLNAVGASSADGHSIVSPEGKQWGDYGDGYTLHMEYFDGLFRTIPGYEDHPAIVRIPMCSQAYATFYGFSLPTEAQWEYAARAFAPGDYPWGDEASCDHGNIWIGPEYYCVDGSAQVASYSPNGFGLFDVCGNVREHCSDWPDTDWQGNYYMGQSYYEWCAENFPSGIVDPSGPPDPPPASLASVKMARGGSPGPGGPASTLWLREWSGNPTFDGFRVAARPPE